MDARLDPALKIAEFLLQIKAVKLSPAKPFAWASGWKSPIYCDNRKILSYPAVRKQVYEAFAALIAETFRPSSRAASRKSTSIA